MPTLSRQSWLPLGAFLAVSVVTLISYIILETSWWYRIMAIVFVGLIAWEGSRRYSTYFARLYLLFLAALCGLELYARDWSELILAAALLIGSALVLFTGGWSEGKLLPWRSIAIISIIFTEVVLLLMSIGGGQFLKAGTAMLAVAGTWEMLKYPGKARWRAGASYAILILLFLILIIITVRLARL